MSTRFPIIRCVVGLIAVGLLLSPVVGLAQDGHDHHQAADDHEQEPTTRPCCGVDQTHETCMATMARLEALLAEAAEAIEDDETDIVAEKIAEAQALLEQHQEAMAEAMHDHQPATTPEDGIVNARCPIMGSILDPDNVPAGLTREFNGQTVGFCCGGCPAAWDRLSDEQKQAKYDQATAESPE